jgi:hypothetical protein
MGKIQLHVNFTTYNLAESGLIKNIENNLESILDVHTTANLEHQI